MEGLLGAVVITAVIGLVVGAAIYKYGSGHVGKIAFAAAGGATGVLAYWNFIADNPPDFLMVGVGIVGFAAFAGYLWAEWMEERKRPKNPWQSDDR